MYRRAPIPYPGPYTLPWSCISHPLTIYLSLVLQLHTAQIVHGDIKPENFLVDTSSSSSSSSSSGGKGGLPRLKLCDFGSSSYLHERLGAYGYTHEYAAPELLADRRWAASPGCAEQAGCAGHAGHAGPPLLSCCSCPSQGLLHGHD